MEYSYKFRLYPNREQENQIQRTFGCCRYVYNYYLAYRKKLYETSGETANYYVCAKDLTHLKHELPWLKEVDSTALQTSIRDLDAAYQNFFRKVKQGSKPGYPHFKSKHRHRGSYQSKCVGTNIKMLDSAIQLPKLGIVKCRISKKVLGRILSATVSQNPSGKYFVSLCCTDMELQPLNKTNAVIGIDVGINSFAVSSDGIEYFDLKQLRKTKKKLARLRRSLSRKSRGSHNRAKARMKVARFHEKLVNQRKDMLHKLSTELVHCYDVVCVEKLTPSMLINIHHLDKSFVDISWGEFKRQLKYKAEWYGKCFLEIDHFYPSNQLCSCCGMHWSDINDLKLRKWTCPTCSTTLDRDTNAAINVLKEGLRLLI